MTHEFKTPISSIKIAADVLDKDEQIQSDARLRNYIGIIKDQNERLNDQVGKVLNIARLENDNLELNFTEFDLVKEMRKILENEKIKLDEGALTYKLPDETIMIRADQLHFNNVITNVIDNAVKYSGSSPEVRVTLTLKAGIASISISDKGIGIPKEQIKDIFQKFYRISTGNVHNVKGFGLGLFYVKNIAKAHGWIPHVTSEVGNGTTFTLDIIV